MNLEHLRHSLAHLLAAAVLKLWPDTKNTIGPAIDNGFYYDFKFSQPISDADLEKIEAEMRKILKTWKGFERHEILTKDALETYKNNEFKQELINQFSVEDKTLTLYTSGEFTDLCRGGHIDDASLINPDAFKLTHIAGAYWRGDEKNPMLTRIYGLAFETKEELEKYLWQQEEAKKRDHKKLGPALDLFFIDEEVGRGLPMWTPRGTAIKFELENFTRKLERKYGYQHVCTPYLASEKLYATSGHLDHYKENMYAPIDMDGDIFYLRPMACPHHIRMFMRQPVSYKSMPIRYAEIADYNRYEKSGELMGMIRLRKFQLTDAHLFVEPQKIKEEFMRTCSLIKEAMSGLGLDQIIRYRFSKHDPTDKHKYFHDDNLWKSSETAMKEALDEMSLDYFEAIGEAAFYGPKLDVQAKNVNGKEDTIITIQLDYLLPQKFGITYINENNEKVTPVMIHRSAIGALERTFAFLIEHYGGAFPLWLAPVQVKILPIADRHHDYVRKIGEQLDELNIRYEIDFNAESVGKKIRNAELEKVPYIFVVGDKEIEANAVAVRKRGEASSAKTPDDQKGDLGVITINEVLERLLNEIKDLK